MTPSPNNPAGVRASSICVLWSPVRQRIVNEKVDDAEGSYSATVNTEHGPVSVFSYRGGRHGDAFTKFDMQLPGREFYARLPRAYGRGWLSRLAGDFARRAAAKQVRLEGVAAR